MGWGALFTRFPLAALIPMSNRLPVSEIAKRLSVGKMAVYVMLEKRILPGIRVGRRWLVTRQAYEQWENTYIFARFVGGAGRSRTDV